MILGLNIDINVFLQWFSLKDYNVKGTDNGCLKYQTNELRCIYFNVSAMSSVQCNAHQGLAVTRHKDKIPFNLHSYCITTCYEV